jgi:hypothetical protein
MPRDPYDYGYYGHIDHWEAYGHLSPISGTRQREQRGRLPCLCSEEVALLPVRPPPPLPRDPRNVEWPGNSGQGHYGPYGPRR